MANESWSKVKEILDAAIQMRPEERVRFLDEACDGDLSVRKEVDSLLSSFEKAGDFMERPVVEAEITEELTSLPDGQLIGRYNIIRQIGHGGMGIVYLARDKRLDRNVAIKVLNRKYERHQENIRRFIREAKAASALNHPNILTIHEIDEFDGTQYIVSEYVEGETLREIIAKGRLGLSKIVNIAEQIAGALAAAHKARIIHRDIKPENIIVRDDGFVKVLDFGLAKLLPEQISAMGLNDQTVRQNETAKGVIMGTVSYMSPEQAKGEPVDERTDIFSLGVVIYEMIAGVTPFAGDSLPETFANLINKEPPHLADCVVGVPHELQWIVSKMLEKDLGRRYQSMKELLSDLTEIKSELAFDIESKRVSSAGVENKTELLPQTTGETAHVTTETSGIHKPWYRNGLVFAAVPIILIAVLAAGWIWRERTTTFAQPEIRSIAVLPLENLSGDPTQEYFADGMTEALINNLSQIRSIKVISRTSVMRYKGSRDPLPDIAKALGVDAIVEGSVVRSGERVRVTAQLVPATTDAAVWSRNYDREMSDLLKLQSDVAQAVAGEIQAKLTEAERTRFAGAKKIDPKASEEFLLGQFYLKKHTEPDLERAVGHFNQAVQIEPEYAEAWAGLSRAWFERGIWGKVAFIDAKGPGTEAATKALELDPDLSIAHTAMSYLNINYDFDWPEAESHLKRAIELDPNSSEAYLAYGWYLLNFGRFDEMKTNMALAERLDPVSSVIQSDFGRMLYRARLFDEALQHLNRAIELDPNNSSAYGRLADVYLETGRFDEALAAEDKADTLTTGPSYVLRRAYIYARMGQREKALDLWKNATVKGSGNMARLYTEFGNFDEAFKELNRGLDQHEAVLPHIRVDPGFDKLHSDPRWAKFLARMNLPPS